MSISLVADYDSSSSEDEKDSPPPSKQETTTAQLASALEMLDESNSNISCSVFSNPYREAENYEQSLLERHVKMTPVKKVEIVEPKKICYKYNKGKCKLGDKCQFLHLSSRINNSEKNNSDSEDQTNEAPKIIKKRCGMTNNLLPPKKFMKTYFQQK